ncbi:MAG: hydantoinase/carbamoylase family amidase [Pseudomonadota bacterium]
MAQANPDRVLRDLYALREVGRYKTGVHRPTLSAEDLQTRHWLAKELRAIGHAAQIDGIANVIGRAPGSGPKILAGSHIESQNYAGWLDGALGVVYALEAARAVAEDVALTAAGAGVDVIAFADEEGHFGHFFGSYSFVGALAEETIDAATDRTDGRRLRHALAEAGLGDTPRARMEQGRCRAFLEAHIEQGDSLEAAGLTIGVVTSIVAIWQYRVVVEGAQNHAGTTSMARRKDAGAALRRICARIEEAFPQAAGPASVWTVGRITLDPGAPSIVPGRAEMLFQLRDSDPAVLDRLHALLAELVAEEDRTGPCTARVETLGQSTPAHMDAAVQAAIEAAAEQHAPGRHLRMPSGAGHDAQNLAPHLPTGMLFVPSIGGISHHWTENTADDDIATGATVFVDAVDRLLKA